LSQKITTKPFVSKRQQRFAFGTGQSWANRWAKETNFATLPEKKDAAVTAGAMAHGPGGLLATPGLGGGKKPRKWGKLRAARSRPIKESELRGFVARKVKELMAAQPSMSQDDAEEVVMRLVYAPMATATIGRKSHDSYPDQTQFAGYTMEDWDDTKPDSFYHDTRPRTRKWGNRHKNKACTCGVNVATKEQIAPGITRIRGNLCNVHGRYGPCDAGAAAKKPKGRKAGRGRKPAKPKKIPLTPEQRAAARQAEHEANRKKTLAGLGIAPDGQEALDALRKGGQPDPGALARGGFEKAGLVEQAADGSYRMTASGRALMSAADAGDAGRAGDTISSARDRTGAREQRQSAAAQRKQAAEERRKQAEARRKQAAERAKKQGAGGGKQSSAAPQREAERQQTRQQRQAEHEADRKQRQQEHAQDRAQRQAEHEQDRSAREAERQQRLREATPAATGPQAPGVLASRPGIVRGRNPRATRLKDTAMETTVKATWTAAYVNNLPDGSFLFVESGGKKDSDGKTVPRSLRHFPYKDANGKTDLPHLRNAIARIPQSNAKGLNKEAVQKRAQKLLANANKSENSFTVFKDDTDAWRWLARTTTAYRDRDNEIITTKALEADADRMNASKQYGPLRYWHLGQPDPFNAENPAGPGVDIGTCDYSIVIGRTSIESGTFKSFAIGKAFAENADDYELSPGFFHPVDQPNGAGEYDQIHRFERSVVPIKYGRASNLFTGMTVKGAGMDQQTYDARVKTFLTDMNDKGVPPEVAAGALAGMEQADKSAQQQGIAYKSEDLWGAVITALKAAVAPPQAAVEVAEKAPPPPDQAAAPAAPAATDTEAGPEGSPEDETQDESEYIGDMSVADFEQLLMDTFQQAIQQFGSAITTSMGALDEAVKGMGYARTKSEGEIAELKKQNANLATRVNALEGDQPAIGLKDVADALASDGPQSPPSADGPVIPNDPDRPFAGWAVKAFPGLYDGSAGAD
jgi:hypothetical protein